MTDLVNFELAKLLKEKGFIQGFDSGQKFYYPFTKELTENYRGNNYPAPTIAEVVMWLYEKYGIWINVSREYDNTFSWGMIKFDLGSVDDFDSPTEAYEAAIKYCLTEIIL